MNSSSTSSSATMTQPGSASIARAARSASAGRDMSCSAFDDRHQVVLAGRGRTRGAGRVSGGERDPVRQAGLLGIAAGRGDRVRVQVETVDADQRVGLRHGDAGPARSAGQVRHPGGRLAAQPQVHVRDGRQPLSRQQVEEHRPVELRPALRCPRQRRWCTTAAHRLGHLGHPARGTDDLGTVERLVADIAGVGENRYMPGRQAVAAGQRPSRRIVDLQQPARGMVFQPFPDIPLGGARPRGQLRGGRRPAGMQGLVQAQPLAQIHGEQFQRAGHVTEQPVGQRRRITRFSPLHPMLLSSHAAQATATGETGRRSAVIRKRCARPPRSGCPRRPARASGPGYPGCQAGQR